MQKFTLVFFTCILLIINGYGQNDHDTLPAIILLKLPQRDFHLTTSGQINQFTQLDTKVSPLVYKGWGAGGSIGIQKRRDRVLNSFSAQYSKGKLYNNFQARQYFAELSHFNIQWTSSYKIPFRFSDLVASHLGWQIFQQSDYRRNSQFQNASLTYNFSTSLSPVIRLEKWFEIKENKQRKIFKKQRYIRLNYQLAFPLIAGVSRPAYNAIRGLHDGSGSAFKNTVAQETLQHLQVYSLNHFIAIYSNFEFQYLMKNGNYWSIQYYWNFENLNVKYSNYKTGQTSIQLSFYTFLNGK